MKDKFKKHNAHVKYKTEDGKNVPGVTTVIGILAKPALIYWSNKIGLQGIEVSKYVDTMANIGTLIHKMIECDFKQEKVCTAEYSATEIDLAENGFLKYLEWRKNKKITAKKNEIKLVSEKYKYGGTADVYCEIDGVLTLLDIKSGKAIYPEMFMQLAAYKNLLEENGYPVENALILRVGREESEGFEVASTAALELHFEKFLACLKIYELNKKLKI